jgi:hypothetical protein
MTMNHVTRAVHNWLMENNLPIEGVRVVIEFPSKESAGRAEMCIKREVEPMMRDYRPGASFGQLETMNGIGLTLRPSVCS